MKKNYFILTFLLLIFSCKQDLDNNELRKYENQKMTISNDDARDYIDNKATLTKKNKLTFKNSKSDFRNMFEISGELNWNNERNFTFKDKLVKEIPFKVSKGLINLYEYIPTVFKDSEGDKKLRLNYSYTNLIVSRNKNSQVMEGYFITYIPQRFCIENLKYFKTGKRMTLNSIDENFTGYIEYKSIDNKVLQVLYIFEGKLVKINKMQADISLVQNKSSITQNTLTSNCRTVCTPKYGRVCVSMPEYDDGESCSTVVIGQDCQTICDSTDPDPEIPTPGGGGSSSGSATGAEFAAEIFNECSNVSKSSEAYQAVVQNLDYLLNENGGHGGFACYTRAMLNFLKTKTNQNGKINLCLDASKTTATYFSGDKSIKFNGAGAISMYTLFHELFHAAQDQIYVGGITQFNDQAHQREGFTSIELEAYVFGDLVSLMTSTETTIREVSFKTWALPLVKQDGKINISSAKMFFEDYNQQKYNLLLEKTNFCSQFPKYCNDVNNTSYNLKKYIPLVAIKHFLNESNCFK